MMKADKVKESLDISIIDHKSPKAAKKFRFPLLFALWSSTTVIYPPGCVHRNALQVYSLQGVVEDITYLQQRNLVLHFQ